MPVDSQLKTKPSWYHIPSHPPSPPPLDPTAPYAESSQVRETRAPLKRVGEKAPRYRLVIKFEDPFPSLYFRVGQSTCTFLDTRGESFSPPRSDLSLQVICADGL